MIDEMLEVERGDNCFPRKSTTCFAELTHEAHELAVYLYNSGYGSGHNDTIEGDYADIHTQDIEEYHDDLVEELLEDYLKEA